MANSKNHHVVPKFLLENFTDVNGQLHLLDKRQAERGLVRKSPAKAFVQFHAYSTELDDGSLDDSVERGLSRLEDRAAPLLKRIVDAASSGHLTSLTFSDWETLNEFTVAQWKRSPDAYTKRLGGFDTDAYYTGLLQQIESQIRPFTDAERAYFYDKTLAVRLTRNAQVEATLDIGPDLAKAMEYVGLLVTSTSHRNRAFIVGSNPVVKLAKPGDTVIGSPNVEIWFPIASHVALVRCGPPNYQLKVIEEQRWFRNVNTAIAKQSMIVAAHAEALVRSVNAAS